MVGNNFGTKSAPALTKFSQYESAPKYTINGKWKLIRANDYVPGPNKYDCRQVVEKLSKFRSMSRPCGFSKADRWAKNKADNVTKGPGQYDNAVSTLKKSDISMGKSRRPDILGKINKGPGPGMYEVRDKTVRMEPTLAANTCNFAGRYGWYYDNLEAKRKPGPGTYSVTHTQTETPVGTTTKIGTSLRPSIESHLGVKSGESGGGPGQYDVPSTICKDGPKYSFTSSSLTKKSKPKDCPPFILQATQWS